jgi:hypothetical protein
VSLEEFNNQLQEKGFNKVLDGLALPFKKVDTMYTWERFPLSICVTFGDKTAISKKCFSGDTTTKYYENFGQLLEDI